MPLLSLVDKRVEQIRGRDQPARIYPQVRHQPLHLPQTPERERRLLGELDRDAQRLRVSSHRFQPTPFPRDDGGARPFELRVERREPGELVERGYGCQSALNIGSDAYLVWLNPRGATFRQSSREVAHGIWNGSTGIPARRVEG